MKLLFDNNLPFRLPVRLKDLFPDSSHIRFESSIFATDLEIWQIAKEKDFIIVTQDDDLNLLSEINGSPRKVIWIRSGNSSNEFIESLIRKNFDIITVFIKEDDANCLILGMKANIF